jgi:hypothetical protein
MAEQTIQFPEAVIISVERLIRFCYLAQIMHEQGRQYNPRQSGLPHDLTRWGTLLFLTGSLRIGDSKAILGHVIAVPSEAHPLKTPCAYLIVTCRQRLLAAAARSKAWHG